MYEDSGGPQPPAPPSWMWMRKLEAEAVEAIKFLWKRKRFEERSWKRKQTRKRLTFKGETREAKGAETSPPP